MATTVSTAKNEVHTKITSSDLETILEAISELGINSSNPGSYLLLKNHILREYNIRCYVNGQTALMISPYDGGLRPTGDASSWFDQVANSIILISGDNILQIGGDDIILLEQTEFQSIGGDDLVTIDGSELIGI